MALWVEQVNRRRVAFAPKSRGQSPLAAHRQHLHAHSLARQFPGENIEACAVTAHDHEIRNRYLATDQGDLDFAAGIDAFAIATDANKAVGPAERGHAPAPLPHRVGREVAGVSVNEPDQ